MVCHVTMEEEVPGQLLTETGSAFGVQIEHLGRADHLHVHAV